MYIILFVDAGFLKRNWHAADITFLGQTILQVPHLLLYSPGLCGRIPLGG